MVKVIIIVVAIFGLVYLVYDQGIKNPTSKIVEVDAENIETAGGDSSITNASSDEKVVPPTVILKNSNDALDLSGQGLTETPNYVFTRKTLETLDLSNNRLTGALQAEIRQLQNLRVLNLANNQFTGVPAEVGQLANLEVLDLSNNNITGLPLELGNLSNLKKLNLKGNDYSKVDLGQIKEKLPDTTIILVD